MNGTGTPKHANGANGVETEKIELPKRIQWMVLKLAVAYALEDGTVQRFIAEHRSKVDAFLEQLDSPMKLFFFFQPRQFKKPELYLSLVGDGEKLQGKCVYFLRNSTKPIKIAVYSDNTVISGEINADLLHTFEFSLSTLYTPVLRGSSEWGHIKRKDDQQNLLGEIDKFDEDLKKKILNLRGDVDLRTPEPPFDKIDQKPAAYAKAAKDKATLTHFSGIVASWCAQITEYMQNDPSKKPLDPDRCDDGPEIEIEYWSRRMLTLISITEQLKTKSSRVVTGVLKARALRGDEDARAADEGAIEQDKIRSLIERWRNVDLDITDSLNEAKDNVRFLENLQKVLEPLATERPSVIADAMPSLMNSMKMIHTLSRHYGTSVRMTNLFERITNQLIRRCKEEIYQHQTVDALWEQKPTDAIAMMVESIEMFKCYKKQYDQTKAKLALMPKGKQFDFDENAIFDKFVRFRRRLEKLIDMFSSIQQFQALEVKRIDGMEILIKDFQILIKDFKHKGHDLLNFHTTLFERDFVEFTMHNSGLENAIQDFLQRSLDSMTNIEKKLELMGKFKDILMRDALQEDLQARYLAVFKLYEKDLVVIQQTYEKLKEAPPLPRNMTKIAGNIHWSRQLLRHITGPMNKFQENPRVFAPRDSKRIVRTYNRLARTLIEFETLWYQAWQRSAEAAKRGLRARLVVADPGKKLYVNFDLGVLQMMREAKHLALMGFRIPNTAQRVLIFEDKLKQSYNELDYALKRYTKILDRITPVAGSLLRPHLLDLENTIQPALTVMTWTSMNVPQFLRVLNVALDNFQTLVSQSNDIITNRIETNLRFVSKLLFLHFPVGKAFSLREFKSTQTNHIAKCTEILIEKNIEIERAVDDLIHTVRVYPLSPEIEPTAAQDINFVKLHYCQYMFFALLDATRKSLQLLRNRIDISNTSPLFEVELSLIVPNVIFTPTLADVQETVQGVACEILQITKKLMDWGIEATARPRSPKPYYDKLAGDKNLAVVLLLLTGVVADSKKQAIQYCERYNKYSWLWMQDIEGTYKDFLKNKNPILEDFVAELQKFMVLDRELSALETTDCRGALLFKTDKIKEQVKMECDRWKHQYSENIHIAVKTDMDKTTDLMSELKSKLERNTTDFVNVKFVMDAQAEIREVQSWIQARFKSIIERYNILEDFLPAGAMSKDEMDAKSVLAKQWNKILNLSATVMIRVNEVAPGFKADLIKSVADFQMAVSNFKADYDAEGPMVPGTAPREAITRLSKYKREFETLNRNYNLYHGGEKLFGLPCVEYPELSQTAKELGLLDRLYNLYQIVISTIDEYKGIPWSEVVANISTMNETVEGFASRCKTLPKTLKHWAAFHELNQTIEDFIAVLPMLNELSKSSMRERHWKAISQLTGMEFDLEKFHELKLKSVIEADLLSYKEDIEEITDGADKQLGIENKLKDTQAIWDETVFEFGMWKDRGEVILAGGAVTEITEKLEESQSALIQMLTQKHVLPFKDIAGGWLKKLSDVYDTLESWIKVQMLWMSLEAVFTGGDIARQMPQDTRVFQKVDKEWTTRLMSKAHDVMNVVECCQNEYIKNMLPAMFSDLEKCQKALDGYLEAKRSKFPRFYFVSNSALLLILSQGSDKEAVQDAFPKIFDAIDRVEFQGNNIVKMRCMSGGYGGVMDSEDILLTKPVSAKGNIEDWLAVLLIEMANTVHDIVRNSARDFESLPLLEFIEKYPGQVALLGIQFLWTNDIQDGLLRSRNEKGAVVAAYKNQVRVLNELSQLTTTDIPTKMKRTKVETLVTIQVHQKDVAEEINKLAKEKKIRDANDFEWQQQLRCYWVPENSCAMIRVADVEFAYCNEYLGCKERLVITPLTDRCYLSLTQALGMCFGGAPAGPAGTGKTETTKDLGRALGKLVVVFNCSDQMHTNETAKMFKGLCQSGSWGCFDEFNRIDLEVLSVVAQQVEAILECLRMHLKQFSFPGDDVGPITVDERCGFFITMNPGYAGRQELPENLKALFRGVAMMVPDREIIMRVKLASVGYNNYATLAQKFAILYKLSEEQLSKQRHYDFGLRNILSVLRTGGVNLRIELKKNIVGDRESLEEMLMMRTLRDMNLAKLVADDVGLFISLLKDLFPAQRDPEKHRYEDEEAALKKIIADHDLVEHESWVAKVIQLYETSLVRHGLMMVGPAGGGKSQGTKVLVEAISVTKNRANIVKMNPKAITAEQMFGQNDLISGEWTHGIFSSIWHKYNDPKKQTTWIVCDGPVDTIWIENLNTVLDDNKMLTLANGDRIPMTDNVRILFEVEDLRNASPATVSRAGIVFVSENDLGYGPLVEAWLRSRHESEKRVLVQLWDHFVVEPDTVRWLSKNTENAMKASATHLVTNLFHLLKGLLHDSQGENQVLTDQKIARLFMYSLLWSLGSLLELQDRKKFSAFIVHLGHLCPMQPDVPDFSQNGKHEDVSLYEYFVHPQTHEWSLWIPPEYAFDAERFDFATALIPTVDSVRAEFLLRTLQEVCERPVLIVGSSGTAKTSIILQYTNQFNPTKMLLKKSNFSSATTAGMFQASMEADIEKRQGRTFVPQGGRKMTVFLDDLSMPEVNGWGDQPTLEIVRQIIEEGGFMFLEKDKRGDKMDIENVFYLGAMNHPGGGRTDIPNRLKRHFFTINCTPPSKDSIDNIYGTMLRGHFEDMPEQEELIDGLTKSTIELWTTVKAKMLPTPSKFHYTFNMRDLSRIFQGVLFCPHDSVSRGDTLLRLWLHECERVFCDKLATSADKDWYKDAAWKTCSNYFGEATTRSLKLLDEPIYFVDFLRDDIIDEETDEVLTAAPKVYEPVPAIGPFKQRVDQFLTEHNKERTKMDLVLFTDALEHMLRIARILALPRGHALLVGVGGSGRQSLTRLAAYIARHEIFQIALTRAYKMTDFMDDIRKMYSTVGKDGKRLTWIFTDFEILKEQFLEYINSILSTGEVAGLFPKDERDMMCADLRGPAKAEIKDFEDTPENLYKYFLNRIRSNLHIVLVFSPANEKFAERARKFPGLIGCCTIDWFLRWPEQALVDVSFKFLATDPNFKIEASKNVTQALVAHIASVHNLVTEGCDEYFQKYRRAVHVTPKSYLAFITGYKSVYTRKLSTLIVQENNVNTGLKKLAEAETDVDKMKGILEEQNIHLQEADRSANAMLEKVETGSREANIKKEKAAQIEEQCLNTAAQIAKERAIANKELEGAMPFVNQATEAAKSINKNDIGLITKLNKPPDLIKRIMDCVLILFQRKLNPVSLTEIKTGKDTYQQFVMDSYDTVAKKVMMEGDFLSNVLSFAEKEKDMINDETIELLDPYLNVNDFNAERARTVANAAEGLCKWVKAMHSYHGAALIVAPLLEELNIKTTLFDAAKVKLEAAQASSARAQGEVDKLQAMFDNTMKQKEHLEQQAREKQEKISAANGLIKSLADEKIRWSKDELEFRESKKRLVGDVALSCAFVSYLGPFNQVFRKQLLEYVFFKDAINKAIPITKDLSVTMFLVDQSVIARWNSQGLPKDELSVQNGILVTQASRYPLLVDPQSQALNWLRKKEAQHFPNFGTTSLTSPKLRDELEFCMGEGKALLIEGIVKEVDPMFDPILEKNLVLKGRTYHILLGDKYVVQDPEFRMYFLTKLNNPTFSPELSAKTTIIDFSVTQKGLEDQLLSRVIQFEQKSLEDQRQELIEAVNQNTISLQQLDAELLERLSNSKGNLLDDVALIQVLADTKTNAQNVKEKIEASKDTEEIINKKREQYRPVARRASIIYFVLVSLPAINVMYQISLAQFLQWFDLSMVSSDKANLVAKRVEILIEYLTLHIYRNVNRGLFEADKLIFKLMITMKIMQTETPHILNNGMVNLLLRGGAALAPDQVPKGPDWLQKESWVNACELATSLDFFGDLRDHLEGNESGWKAWYESANPEDMPIPSLQDRVEGHPSGPFMRMLLIRCFRIDRFRLAAQMFIAATLGTKYVEPESIQLEDIWRDADRFTPVILLLTPGADPTTALQDLAKKKGVKTNVVSMGEGQEKHAKKCVEKGKATGGWALLQNCHLGLGFMNQLQEEVQAAEKKVQSGEAEISEAYRLWITCEPHKDFPINMLQMSIKVTNEPPAGMKAGLFRSYTSAVDVERLNRVESKDWRTLVFALCFLHSSVQERRKFGAVGWCIPYEFNAGDLEASLTFLEKHFFNSPSLSWPTIQYMICDVQYGGRITDDLDRVLFKTFGKQWLSPATLQDDFKFCRAGGTSFDYYIPQVEAIENYLTYIAMFPSHDNPEIFGLHPNADLTFGKSEAVRILNTILATQPKDGGKGGGKTREECVYERADEMLKQTPPAYKDGDVRDAISKRPKAEIEIVLGHRNPDERVDGFSIPLNVFLYQEVTRLNAAIGRVRRTFLDLKQAIDGEIIMTPQLQNSLNDIYDSKPPRTWYIDPSGAEIAWSSPTLANWFLGLIDRNKQLSGWLTNGRPATYWLTGFFNPQGYLTAARQEITRRHAHEKWALDDVVLRTDVTDYTDPRRIKDPYSEGFFITGLYLEGASWDKKEHALTDSLPKELFSPLPILKINATTSSEAKKYYAKAQLYDCPWYTRPQRTGLAFVASLKMPVGNKTPEYWTLRGVALLCTKE